MLVLYKHDALISYRFFRRSLIKKWSSLQILKCSDTSE